MIHEMKFPVTNLEQLDLLVKEGRSVCVPTVAPWKEGKPAAFMINQPGATLLLLFRAGMYVRVIPKQSTGRPRKDSV